MQFLVTNDDGILSDEIRALRDVSCEFGQVVMVAPMADQSGKGHSITLHRPLRVNRVADDAYGVEGTPTDSVLIALRILLKDRRPDWVLSGINPGGNLGNDTLYSGTVAAVVEAAVQGHKGIAFSLHGPRPYRLDTAQIVVRNILRRLGEINLPERSCLNINIPNLPWQEIKGFTTASLGQRLYDERIHDRHDPRGKPYYWIGSSSPDAYVRIAGSDCDLVQAGYVTMTVLRVDYFHKQATDLMSQQVKKWEISE